MAEIEVEREEKRGSGWIFRVQITEGGTSTEHQMTVEKSDHRRLSPPDLEPEELVRGSIRFLLEREPKESILTEFDLTTIGDYFPEYENEISRYLESR